MSNALNAVCNMCAESNVTSVICVRKVMHQEFKHWPIRTHGLTAIIVGVAWGKARKTPLL